MEPTYFLNPITFCKKSLISIHTYANTQMYAESLAEKPALHNVRAITISRWSRLHHQMSHPDEVSLEGRGSGTEGPFPNYIILNERPGVRVS